MNIYTYFGHVKPFVISLDRQANCSREYCSLHLSQQACFLKLNMTPNSVL